MLPLAPALVLFSVVFVAVLVYLLKVPPKARGIYRVPLIPTARLVVERQKTPAELVEELAGLTAAPRRKNNFDTDANDRHAARLLLDGRGDADGSIQRAVAAFTHPSPPSSDDNSSPDTSPNRD